MNKISIFIVEDYLLTRITYKKALSIHQDIDIRGDFGSAEECIEALKQQEVQVILMDIGLPGMTGIQATKIITEKYPNVKIIMLTSHNREQEVLSSLSSGAHGYALNDISMEELYKTIVTVNSGSIWIAPQIAQIVQRTFYTLKPQEKVDFNLTDREKEVLGLMVQGLSNTEIAKKIFVSPHTVKAHVCNILNKLTVTDRVQAAVKAVQYDI